MPKFPFNATDGKDSGFLFFQFVKKVLLTLLSFIMITASSEAVSADFLQQKKQIKIGIVTDTHYKHTEDCAERAAAALDIADIFNSNEVDIVLHLGDAYEGNYAPGGTAQEKEQDYLEDKKSYEPAWQNTGAPVYWLIGNHDTWGISEDFFINNCSYCPGKNFTVDINEWRFVCYSNVDEPTFSATPDTLTWLGKALEDARLQGKKIIVCTHCRIDQDYPGTPPAYTAGIYSAFSYNADEQRNIINTAADAGANIKYVFQGHHHTDVRTVINGIAYYEFESAGDTGSCAVVEIQDDDSLIVRGYGNQASYEVNQFYVDGDKGSDENSGVASDTAWKTLSYANKKIENGQTVIVLPAIYKETFRPEGGEQGSPRKWIFQPGCSISGLDVFSGWSETINENGWHTLEGIREVGVLFEDGVKLQRGTYTSRSEKGTWDWNDETLYYCPSEGYPKMHTVEGGQRNKGVYIAGDTDWLTIDGGGLEIYGCNTDGIYFDGGSLVLTDFISRDNGRAGLWSSSSSFSCNMQLSRFIIQNNGQRGIYISEKSSLLISYGIISRSGEGLYIRGFSEAGIYNLVSVFNDYGIRLSNTGGNIELKNIILRENTIYNFYASDEGTKSVTNAYIPSSETEWGNTHSEDIYSEAPLFADPDADNFRLQRNSPCIDRGAVVPDIHDQAEPAKDIAGNLVLAEPDIGAYEYNALSDFICILRVTSGGDDSYLSGMDFNNDGRVGLEDAISVLQILSEEEIRIR